MTINRRAMLARSVAVLAPSLPAITPANADDNELLVATADWQDAQRAFNAMGDVPAKAFAAAVRRMDGLAARVFSLRAKTRAGIEAKAAAIDELIHGFHDDEVYLVINSLLADMRAAVSA